MSVLKKIILISIVALFFSCNEKKKYASDDYRVLKEAKTCVNNKTKIAVLFFETSFKNDLIEVFVNDKQVFKGEVTTDETLGYAQDVALGDLNNVNKLSISINNGKTIDLVDLSCNYIFINYQKDSIASVRFDNEFVPYQ